MSRKSYYLNQFVYVVALALWGGGIAGTYCAISILFQDPIAATHYLLLIVFLLISFGLFMFFSLFFISVWQAQLCRRYLNIYKNAITYKNRLGQDHSLYWHDVINYWDTSKSRLFGGGLMLVAKDGKMVYIPSQIDAYKSINVYVTKSILEARNKGLSERALGDLYYDGAKDVVVGQREGSGVGGRKGSAVELEEETGSTGSGVDLNEKSNGTHDDD